MFEKKKIFCFLSLVLSFILCFSFVGVAFAASVADVADMEKLILEEGAEFTNSTDTTAYFSLYLDKDTPLTLQSFVDNPELSFILSNDDGSTQSYYFNYFSVGGSSYFVSRYFNTEIVNYNLLSGLIESGSYDLDAPLFIHTSSVGTFSVEALTGIEVTPTPTPTPTPSPEVTEDPAHGGGGTSIDGEENPTIWEQIADGFTKLFDNLAQSFVNLFKPITSFLQTILDFFDSLGSSVSEVWENLSEYEFTAITDFLSSLNNGAIQILASIFDFPIIKEFIIALVAVLVFGGIILLFTSL